MALPLFKALLLARAGWKRIPKEQRRRMMKTAAKQARTHGPKVAKAIRQVRKAR